MGEEMKVLFVSSISYQGVGGSSSLLRDIIDGLVLDGHHVESLTFDSRTETVRVPVNDDHAFIAHHVAALRLPGASSAAMLTRLISLAGRRHFDLILCGVASPSAILVYLCRGIIRCPYAVYSHGEDVTCVEKESRLRQLLCARALRCASAIMANSTHTRNAIQALGVSQGHLHYVPPWIDVARFTQVTSAQIESLRRRWSLDGKRIILTVARLDARKGHDTIIRALPALRAQVPEVHYVIVGRGSQDALRALAEAEGVRENITFIEYVIDSELPALYHLCDVYAMVSRWDPSNGQVEGFGIVYLEAAACGKPTVAGSFGGCSDAVRDGVTGLIVDPTSVEQTRDGLRALLLDPERAVRMGMEGRQWVRRHFDKQRRGRSVNKVLESVVPHAPDVGKRRPPAHQGAGNGRS